MGNPIDFVHNLFRIISSSNPDTIRWSKDGTYFKILQRNVLVNEVFPKYFSQMKKFASFQRQLNYFGFKRHSKEQSSYYHAHFQRDRKELLTLVKRKTEHNACVDPTLRPTIQQSMLQRECNGPYWEKMPISDSCSHSRSARTPIERPTVSLGGGVTCGGVQIWPGVSQMGELDGASWEAGQASVAATTPNVQGQKYEDNDNIETSTRRIVPSYAESKVLGGTTREASLQHVRIAPKNEHTVLAPSQVNEERPNITSYTDHVATNIPQATHNFAASHTPVYVRKHKESDAQYESTARSNSLASVDAIDLSILAEVASKETEGEQIIYALKNIPRSQNIGMFSLHVAASYGHNALPYFSQGPQPPAIALMGNKRKAEKTSRSQKKAKLDRQKSAWSNLEKMLQMTRPVNLPSIEAGGLSQADPQMVGLVGSSCT